MTRHSRMEVDFGELLQKLVEVLIDHAREIVR